jgi:Phosphate-selective porin O and P
MRRVTLGRSMSASLLGAATLLVSSATWAQEETANPAAPAPGLPPAAGEAPAPGDASVEPTEAAPVPAAAEEEAAPAATKAEMDELRAQVAALQAKQDEAEMNALLVGDDVDVEQELFRVYGFMDMGLQKTWVDEKALIAGLFDTNALTFAVGNINLYFDFNPDPDWRGLAEIRFTSAPLGNIESFGGIAGTFARTDTQQYDPHGSVINAPMWGGYTVIERAWIEWKKFQQFRLRVGNFFTPFGIWNVDHGSPTLISTAMPQFVQQMYFPIRQTGVQALGSFFKGDWEIAYRAWLTNGRTEENPLDFSDNKAFGGRLFARKDGGDVGVQVGTSYHHGSVEDKQVNIISAPPLSDSVEFEAVSSWEFTENVFGVDLSLDIGDTRIRSEGTARLKQYEPGKRPGLGITAPVQGALEPDAWSFAAYALIAQQLPWWGLEPYMYAEVMQQHWGLPDGVVVIGPGINVRFNPSAMLKLQATRAIFFDWVDSVPGDDSLNNGTSFVSRLVLAF